MRQKSTPTSAAVAGKGETETATISRPDFNTGSTNSQTKIADFLGSDRESALTAREIAAMVGLPPRGVTLRIEKERRNGCPICASSRGGYWVSNDPGEVQQFIRNLRHRAHEILTTAREIERGNCLD